MLLPHIRDRAMVMRRYPNGAAGASFFMKEAPSPRPPWIRICAIDHGDGKVVNFPVIDDRPSLLWLINLGCIDLNQWYARCDDVHPGRTICISISTQVRARHSNRPVSAG